jgi:Raf kinase inhibitor-like YbhB/YbcL family protein
MQKRVSRMRRRALFLVAASALLVASCSSTPSGSGDAEKLARSKMNETITVTSTATAEGAPIPRRYTCDGEEVSPPLSWNGAPDDAAALALVVDDPDAPGGTYVHWVLFALDPSLTALQLGTVPAGARQAKNSAGDAKYKGPCPPKGDGAHHYRFTIYALRSAIDAPNGAATNDALSAIRDAATAKGTLTATYER